MWDGGARDGVGSDVAVPNLEIVDRVFIPVAHARPHPAAHMRTHMRTHMCTHTHTHTHTCARAHIHTHAHARTCNSPRRQLQYIVRVGRVSNKG